LQKKEGDDYSLRPLHYITCFRYSDTRVKTNGSSSVEVVRRECAVGHVVKKLLGLYKDTFCSWRGENANKRSQKQLRLFGKGINIYSVTEYLQNWPDS
jgi:hypothetical protein